MKRRLISMLLVVALLVLCLPQNATKAEAAVKNYQRAIAQYQVVYNVADYGIDTKGKKDCGAQISSLVRKLAKERGNDETIPIVLYMPSGKYKVTAPIKLYQNNLHLFAENDTVVTGDKGVKNLIEANNVKDITVTGGKWDGNYKSKYGMKINNAKNVSVSESVFTRASERGFYAINSTANINAIKAYKNKKYGVAAQQGSTITMKNSMVYQNSFYGVCIVSSTIHMEDGNNKVYNNDYTGVAVSGKTGKIYASNNSFTGNGRAKDSKGHGIGLASAYGEINNNKIEKNKQCGISLITKAKAVVVNNSIKNNGRHGIGAAENSTLTAENNTVTGNKWQGIMLRDKGKGVIVGNILNKNAVSGLSLDKVTATVTGNTISGNKSNGIITTAANVTMKDNIITKNKSFGLYTSSGSKVKIVSGNVIKSNSKGDVDAVGSKVTIGKGNTVKKIIK